jgi:CubicO group peptidase (beta-lactamase class C family)
VSKWVGKTGAQPSPAFGATTPEEQGIDSALLVSLLDRIRERDLNIHSLHLLRNGCMVLDVYFHPFQRGWLHDIASCTKSFTATLIGIAVDKGCIRSVQEPVLNFFPRRSIANRTPYKEAMTVEHLLTMASGLDCNDVEGESTTVHMTQSSDWVQFMLNLPMANVPGERFNYCNGASLLLSAVLQEATGMAAHQFAERYLFGPLAIKEFAWPTTPRGVTIGWGDLQLMPHDMAKLGLLYWNGGEWEGKRVLSTDWVKTSTSARVSTGQVWHAEPVSYGYQWWRVGEEIHAALGRGGQKISFVPRSNLVLVHTASLSEEETESLHSLLLPAIMATNGMEGPLPPDPGAVEVLQSRIRDAATGHDIPQAVPPLPETARRMSGLIYALEPNRFGFTRLSLSFPGGNEAVLQLSTEDATAILPVGLDNVHRIVECDLLGTPARLLGFWETDSVFVMHYEEITRINNHTLRMAFSDEGLHVVSQERTGLAAAEFRGRPKLTPK